MRTRFPILRLSCNSLTGREGGGCHNGTSPVVEIHDRWQTRKGLLHFTLINLSAPKELKEGIPKKEISCGGIGSEQATSLASPPTSHFAVVSHAIWALPIPSICIRKVTSREIHNRSVVRGTPVLHVLVKQERLMSLKVWRTNKLTSELSNCQIGYLV